MAEFEFLAFNKFTGEVLGHGATVKATKEQASKRVTEMFKSDPANEKKVCPDTEIIFLRAGDTGPYIWNEKLNYERAKALLTSIIPKMEIA